MRASTGDQRPLQRLVDGRHVLGGEPRLQQPATAAASTSASSAAYSAAFSIVDAVERHLRLAGAGDLRRMRSVWWPSQRSASVVEAVAAAPGVEHVGHQHGVVVGLQSSMPRRAKICQSYFRFCADLEDAGVFQQRLERVERRLLRNLVRRRAWPPARTGRCRPARRRRDGRAARSRPRCRPTASEMPHSCAFIGSRLVVSVSIATTPSPWRARSRRSSRSSVRTVSYLRAVELGWPCAAAMRRGQRRRRQVAARLGLAARLRRRREQVAALAGARREPCAGAVAGARRRRGGRGRRPTSACASASISLASMPDFSATRRVSVMNSIALRKAIRCL